VGFVLQNEAKIMQNGMLFASILHGIKKNSSEKGTLYYCNINMCLLECMGES
jgi:hypothetical protein